MTYDVVFLDWDGTLSNSKFWGHWATDNAHLKKYNSLQTDFFATSPTLIENWMRGNISAEEVVNIVAEKTTISRSSLLKELEASCKAMQFIDPTLPDLIQKLRSNNVKVVITTDNMDTFTRWTVPALQLDTLCDKILDSFSLRALKLDKDATNRSKFFAGFMAGQAIDPARALLIDDSTKNRKVTTDFGIAYVQVTTEYSAAAALSDLLGKQRYVEHVERD